MAITREALIVEAKRRGLQVPGVTDPGDVAATTSPEQQTAIDTVADKRALYLEAVRRGLVKPTASGVTSAAETLRSFQKQPWQPRTFMEKLETDVEENWPQYGGGTAGGIAGAAIGSAVPGIGTVVGGVVGSALGGASGKGYQQGYDMLANNEAITMPEIATGQAVAGLEEGVGSLVGDVAAKGGQKLLSAGVRAALGPDAIRTAKVLLGAGSHASLAQLSDARWAQLAESIAQASWGGGGVMHNLKLRSQPEAAKTIVEDFLDDYASGIGRRMPPSEIGKLVTDSISGNKTAWRTAEDAAYLDLDRKVAAAVKANGGVAEVVDMRPIKKYAEKTIKDSFELAPSVTGDTLLKKVAELPDSATFTQAKNARSSLIKLTQAASASKDVAAGQSKHLTQMFHEQMELAGNALSPDVIPAWDAARQISAEGAEVFKDKLIRKLVKTAAQDRQPGKIMQMVFGSDSVSPDSIRLVKDAMDPAKWNSPRPSQWNAVRYGLVSRWLTEATSTAKDTYGLPQGHVLLQQLDALEPGVMDEVLSKPEQTALRDAAKALMTIQRERTTLSKPGTYLVQILQAGALGGGYFSKNTGVSLASAGVFSGPYVLGRIMASPSWSRMLTQTMRDPKNSRVAAQRLLVIAEELGKEYARDYTRSMADRDQPVRKPDVFVGTGQ